MAKRLKGATEDRQNNWYAKHERSLEIDEIMYEPFWRVEDIKSSGVKTKIAHFKTPYL